MLFSSTLLALPSLLRLASARAFWIPDELQKDAASWIPEDFSPLARRADTCGGVPGLDPCGNPFPSDFCCPTGSSCLILNTTSNIQATLCCPAGQDCAGIAPVQCDTALQNATTNPNSQLHSDPIQQLETCGSKCCPMGYQCQNGNCVALTAAQVSSSSTLPATTSSPTATSTGSTTSSSAPATTTSSAADTIITTIPLGTTSDTTSQQNFSGKSFAAGFIPGIVLGALVAAGLILCMLRKERRKSNSYVNEKKHYSSGRDTLTDLGPDIHRRPTVHGRSISEPTADISMGHRTEFLHSTPPRDDYGNPQGYAIHVQSPPRNPITPATRTQESKPRAWLSHSPFVNQVQTPIPTHSPVPAHLKRGTLSFHVSPIRALKKQKSMHSLRRHKTTRSNSSRPDLSRSDSTETIKVLMATPDQPPKLTTNLGTLPSAAYQPQHTHPSTIPVSATGTWVTESTDSTPIEAEPNTYTPTRPGRNSNVQNVGATLNSPYTPSNYRKDRERLSGLMPPDMGRDRTIRNTGETTFSAIMEKVGLRRTILYGPGGPDGKGRAM